MKHTLSTSQDRTPAKVWLGAFAIGAVLLVLPFLLGATAGQGWIRILNCAMLGGLLLGLIEALGSGYVGNLTNGVFGSHYQDVFSFIVLVVVLIFRPSGLLGERSGDRA